MTDIQSLKSILTDLQKEHWLQPLGVLAEKFKRIPEEDSFLTEITNLLLQLRSDYSQDPSLPLQALTAIRISNLASFCYRFSKNGQTLNPLQDPVSEFQLPPTQAQHAFPAPDIIRRWSRENLT